MITARGSLAGRPVALASPGEALGSPCVYVAHPFPAGLGRWADPRVVGSMAVTQSVYRRAALFDPWAYLIGSADGPVTGDHDIDVVRHVLEQLQPNEVVLDRVIGAVQSSSIGIRTSDSMSSATRTPRSSINSAACPEHALDPR